MPLRTLTPLADNGSWHMLPPLLVLAHACAILRIRHFRLLIVFLSSLTLWSGFPGLFFSPPSFGFLAMSFELLLLFVSPPSFGFLAISLELLLLFSSCGLSSSKLFCSLDLFRCQLGIFFIPTSLELFLLYQVVDAA